MAHPLPNPVDVLVEGATFRAAHGPMIVAKVDPAGQAIAEGDLDTHFGQLQANWNEDLALATQAAIGSVARTVFAADVGEDLEVADVALGGGWGDDGQATITAGSRDGRGRISIEADGGNYAANPTVTITFRGGAFAVAPWPMAQQVGGSDARAHVDSSATTTTLTLTWRGTPVAGAHYILAWRLDR